MGRPKFSLSPKNHRRSLSLPLSLSRRSDHHRSDRRASRSTSMLSTAPRSAWICMRIPSCLQRLSGNRSADREGEGCTGDTDIFLTSKGTYGRFFDAASMQTSARAPLFSTTTTTTTDRSSKRKGGRGRKEGGKGFTQLRHESTFKEWEFVLKSRCKYVVDTRTFDRASRGAAIAGVESVSRGRFQGIFEIDRVKNSLGWKIRRGRPSRKTNETA